MISWCIWYHRNYDIIETMISYIYDIIVTTYHIWYHKLWRMNLYSMWYHSVPRFQMNVTTQARCQGPHHQCADTAQVTAQGRIRTTHLPALCHFPHGRPSPQNRQPSTRCSVKAAPRVVLGSAWATLRQQPEPITATWTHTGGFPRIKSCRSLVLK